MYEIEKGIELPEPRKKFLDDPCGQMEVGDSFLVSADKDNLRTMRNRMNARFVRLRPKKFATRTVEGGFRVWRTD